jgi:DsbC/DsbD-like thiol-disulfide interchange protein
LAFGFAACGSSQPEAETPKAADSEDDAAEAPAFQPTHQESIPDVVVRAALGTNATAVQPGGTFLLLLGLSPIDGYRLHWKNAGDIGAPIKATFTGPEGFEMSEPLFPAPSRFPIEGGMVAYGYEQPTAVFARVTAPKKLDMSGTYRFDVTAKWLACKKECAKEETNAFFELTAAWNAPQADMESDIEQTYQRLPTPFSELEAADSKWGAARGKKTLTLSAKGTALKEFYPLADDSWKLTDASAKGDDLVLSFQAPKNYPHPVRGVVAAESDGKAAFYDVEVSWPTAGKL